MVWRTPESISSISHQSLRALSLQQNHRHNLALRSEVPIRAERADKCQSFFFDLSRVCCQPQDFTPFLWSHWGLVPWRGGGVFGKIPFLLHYLVTVYSARAHPRCPDSTIAPATLNTPWLKGHERIFMKQWGSDFWRYSVRGTLIMKYRTTIIIIRISTLP